MWRSLWRPWLASACACALAAGCCHCEWPRPPACVARVFAEDVPLAGGEVPSSYQVRAAPDGSGAVAPAPTQVAKHHRARPRHDEGLVLASLPAQAEPVRALAVVSGVEWHVEAEPASASLGPPLAPGAPGLLAPLPGGRGPLPVLLAEPLPAFAHAADYSWLVGSLDRDERGGWALRYGYEAEGDPYGGCLKLVSVTGLAAYRPGQLVRVEGRLIDPGPHETKPAYRVVAIQAVEGR